MCFPVRGTHITRDMCFLGRGMHFTRDMCFLGREHILLGICVSRVGEHILLGIGLANTSGLLKKTTSTTLSPGAFYLHTCGTTAQANDATYVLKKNSLSSADPNSLHLTNVMNSCLPAATETKPSCATTDVTNLALNKLCKSV